MIGTLGGALRYSWNWAREGNRVVESEIQVDRGEGRISASLILPRRRSGPLPGWVVLHGITVPGRRHPGLLRFARALASTPAAVLIPEIPEWKRLELAPGKAVPTIRAAILALDARAETAPGRTGLVGFSFGAPQALVASTAPELQGHLAAVVAFGGYCDLQRTMEFQFTGEHEWQGVREKLRPDPYGRWVVGANYLTALPGMEEASDVAQALRKLAAAAGEHRIASWDPALDPVKEALRAEVAPRRREIFDLFAPPSHREPDPERALQMAQELCREASARDPLLDPRPGLAKVPVPVHLLHGHADPLIPYTEVYRLQEALPDPLHVRTTVTGLFAHSEESRVLSLLHGAQEGVRFLGALRAILASV